MTASVLVGDCLAVMPTLDANSVDAIVTDPPYHLTTGKKGGTGVASLNPRSPAGRSRVGTGFMGKAWDGGDVAFRVETWEAALRVAKPGAHLVAFGGTRTYHHLTCAIEDAGWEIRDNLCWLYGSGFPKSHNGPWGGTALKPAWEPIVLARKPLAGTVAGNVERFGTGALNIDGCRIAADERPKRVSDRDTGNVTYGDGLHGSRADGVTSLGRWPANVVLDEDAAALLNEASGELTSNSGTPFRENGTTRNALGVFAGRDAPGYYGDSGGASRFYYTAKASRAERNAGLDTRPLAQRDDGRDPDLPGGNNPRNRGARLVANSHPTVKPLDLMQWLCRLVTPKGGLILDPFTGSGSTGRAAVAEGFRFLGIELSDEYASIARARIAEYAPLFNGAA